MKPYEMRDLTDANLQDHIATVRRDLFGLRMQHATGELDNTARLREVRRDLARALTTARQRGLDPNETTTTTTTETATDDDG
jgi:large subunit ribosomal protein L29